MGIAATDPVPPEFRGVWRRSLLRTPDAEDTTSTVYWMQTSIWHADIRVPPGRPSFRGVSGFADCREAQLRWLATQQGFAGVTWVDASSNDATWQRVVDFQPPSSLPDRGNVVFRGGMLVETGIHADYVEHWHLVPGSNAGFAVLQQLDSDRPAWLLVAGQHVMYVRPRAADFDGSGWGQGDALRAQLDFELSFGERSMTGWTVLHSTFPWREKTAITVEMGEFGDPGLSMIVDGKSSRWSVLEWTQHPPFGHNRVAPSTPRWHEVATPLRDEGCQGHIVPDP